MLELYALKALWAVLYQNIIENYTDEELLQAGKEFAEDALSYHPDFIAEHPFTFQELDKSAEVAYRKSRDPMFYYRAFKKAANRHREARALYAGIVGSKASGAKYKYASETAFNTYKRQQLRNKEFAENAVVFDSATGDSVALKDVMMTPEMQAAKRLSFLKAVEQLALDAQLKWAMLTITLPSEYHPNPANGKKSFNGVTFDDQQKLLSKAFAKIRAMCAKSDIKLSGVRVHEPHADGTPHWHVLFFYQNEEQLKEITRCAFYQFPARLRTRRAKTDSAGHVKTNKNGSLQFDVKVFDTVEDFVNDVEYKTAGASKFDPAKVACQCQLDVGAAKLEVLETDTEAVKNKKEKHNSKVSSMSSYVMKYVNKTTVSTSKDQDTSESLPLSLIAANRQIWGIRSVQFFGIPQIAEKWDMLRKVDTKSPDVSPVIREYALLAQQAKGTGVYELMKRAGGLAIAPVEPEAIFESLQAERESRHGARVYKATGIRIQTAESGTHHDLDGLKSLTKSIQTKRAAAGFEAGAGSLGGRKTPVSGSLATQLVYIYISVTDQLGGDTSTPNPFVCSTAKQAIKAQQIAACAAIDRSHALIAAAGAGKSYTIVERAKYLLKNGVSKKQILVFSFTKDSSRDLAARLVKAGYTGMNVSTMHSCARTFMKNTSQFVEHSQQEADKYIDDFLNANIEEHKKAYYVLVDEAQDLNEQNYRFLNYLSKTLYAVGDFRQAIYRFRGARPDLFNNYKDNLQNSATTIDIFDEPALVHDILTTFRNSTAVNAFANAIAYQLDNTASFTASLDTAKSGAIHTHITMTEQEEYEAIKGYLLSAPKSETKQNAVLCRTKKQLLYIKSRIDVHGIKDVVLSTIHASKGLEYNCVVIASGARAEHEDDIEFANLAYVAVTRAEDEVLITSRGALPAIFAAAIKHCREYQNI